MVKIFEVIIRLCLIGIISGLMLHILYLVADYKIAIVSLTLLATTQILYIRELKRNNKNS